MKKTNIKINNKCNCIKTLGPKFYRKWAFKLNEGSEELIKIPLIPSNTISNKENEITHTLKKIKTHKENGKDLWEWDLVNCEKIS